jgi:hypothetical protein
MRRVNAHDMQEDLMDRFFKDINTRFRGLRERGTSEKEAPQAERESVVTSQAESQDETQAKSEDGVAAQDDR